MTRLLVLLALLGAGIVGLPLTAALALAAAGTAVVQPAAFSEPPSAAATAAVPAGFARTVLAWADSHAGDRYVMGADGPHAWDCSSFARAAWSRVGVRMPRVAQDQRDWLAAGHGTRVAPGREQPGDLVFWDSYLGPRTIGHVVLVHDPGRHTTIDARSTRLGVGHFTYHSRHHRYEIWRPRLEHQL